MYRQAASTCTKYNMLDGETVQLLRLFYTYYTIFIL